MITFKNLAFISIMKYPNMKYCLVLFFLIAMTTFNYGQTLKSNIGVNAIDYQLLKQQFNIRNDYNLQFNRQNIAPFHSAHAVVNTQSNNLVEVPKAYNYEELAIFCKLEVQLEKAVQIPIKFRLGEFNQIEKMEGKPYTNFLIN